MRIFGLLDCNSFYASCEQVFRPHLQGRAVVVLSNNDGCVVARTAEAKKLGIPMGEPYFRIRRLAEAGELTVFSSNYMFYGDMSRRVMQALKHWTPRIEIYSIDEAFLEFTGIADIDRLPPDLPGGVEAAREAFLQSMVRTIRQWTGIPVSLGIGPTKTLAKAANRVAKSNGRGTCSLMDPAVRREHLQNFPIGDVWGVGHRLRRRFERLGLRTALDLAETEPWWMRKHCSIVQEKMVRELRGEPCLEWEETPPPRKNIQVSRSFGERTDDRDALRQALASFATRGAEKLRAQEGLASAVYVHMNTNRFMTEQPSYSNGIAMGFGIPTDSTRKIISRALEGFERIYRKGYAIQKAGVMLLDIQPRGGVRPQQYLFDPEEEGPKGEMEQRQRTEDRLMRTLDQVNDLLGPGTLFFAAEGVERSWKPSAAFRSPCFTTRWEDLPVVRAD
jgi:DNA polymerase V